MEKYAKLLKGLEKCAGPECCKDGCPYYGETRGGMTCRARLLLDANIAITNEQARAVEAEGERDKLAKECNELTAYAHALEEDGRSVRRERDKLNQELTAIIRQRDELAADKSVLANVNGDLREENNTLRVRCAELVDANDDLRKSKTDRPSVCDKELMEEVGKLIAQAKYQEGRADTLAAIVERCSFGGGCCHE